MGCRYTKVLGCSSVACCCCVEADEACWWIAAVGMVWGAIVTAVDFIAAYLPEEYCEGCLDHSLHAKLSLVAGCINAVQWVASVVLLQGARKENKWLLVPWLAWSVVSLAMLLAWVVVTLPYTPSLRGTISLIQLGWGIHYFLVVRTQYTRMTLKLVPPEEAPFIVPPNTPVRRHKLRRRRLDPACQPPIRVLLGAALRLQRHHQRDASQGEEEEEEEEEVRVVVGSHGGVIERREEGEQSCSRRRSGRMMTYDEGKSGGEEGVEASDIIIHTTERDVRIKVEHRTPRREEDEGEDKDEDEGAGGCEAMVRSREEGVAVVWRASHARSSLSTD